MTIGTIPPICERCRVVPDGGDLTADWLVTPGDGFAELICPGCVTSDDRVQAAEVLAEALKDDALARLVGLQTELEGLFRRYVDLAGDV